jgi:DNA-directed RNA polymerase subunit RPC12/RpoP
MAFFEDFGKKVSQTSQDAIKKTKAMAESARINSQISAENKIIWDNYTKLGQRYYELNGENPDDCLAEYVEAIRNARQKIEEYEQQVTKLKGLTRCPNCGAEMKDAAVFCTACGTKLPEPPPEEEQPAAGHACKNCGRELGDGTVFCPGCGTKAE